MEKEKNRPCFVKKVGAIRLTIFENGENGRKWLSVSLSRSYRSGDEWKETNTLSGEGDLVQAAWAIQSALEWLQNRPNGHTEHENGDN
jgi:hypothetical protein